MCFSFKSRGSLRGLQPIIEPGWASLSKPLNRKMSPQEKQSNLTHSGNIIIYSGNAWQVIMPPPPWRGQLNAHRWEGGFLIVWHNFPSVQLLQVKGIWWSLSLTSLASVQYFCFLKLILSFLVSPPHPAPRVWTQLTMLDRSSDQVSPSPCGEEAKLRWPVAWTRASWHGGQTVAHAPTSASSLQGGHRASISDTWGHSTACLKGLCKL